MEFIRFQRSQPDYNAETRHCLYGLDADLMMLGLCSHEPYFSLLREEVRVHFLCCELYVFSINLFCRNRSDLAERRMRSGSLLPKRPHFTSFICPCFVNTWI